jgi:hypothetical protein
MQAILKDEGCGVALTAMSFAATTGKGEGQVTDWGVDRHSHRDVAARDGVRGEGSLHEMECGEAPPPHRLACLLPSGSTFVPSPNPSFAAIFFLFFLDRYLGSLGTLRSAGLEQICKWALVCTRTIYQIIDLDKATKKILF